MTQAVDNLGKESMIVARSLCKTYRIWKGDRSRLAVPLLRMGARIAAPLPPLTRMMQDAAAGQVREFAALSDLSLSVPRGQCLGIVGRNGSGKSTLLQLICGILRPSAGSVNVRGRVAALLELGSGFNPEFTGKENVFLNASILGLSQQDVKERFDEIVEFADIGDFVEQPVKTYSSGMMLRLAFAVQVLVDPDVLIVDEALSVGDEPFQRKCFARLEKLREQGVTVLFVSHDMTPILNLCDRAILLHKGRMCLDSTPKHVASVYQRFNHASAGKAEDLLRQLCGNAGNTHAAPDENSGEDAIKVEPHERCEAETLSSNEGQDDAALVAAGNEIESVDGGPVWGDPAGPQASYDEQPHPELYDPGLSPDSTQEYDELGATISNIRLVDQNGFRVNQLKRRERYSYRYRVDFEKGCTGVNFAMLIKTIMGVELGGARSLPAYKPIENVGAGACYEVSFSFQCNLTPGVYCMNAGVEAELEGRPSYACRVLDALMFRVRPERDMIPTITVDFLIEPSFARQEE